MVDVLVIGGGISGCSLLYALSRYKLNLLLLEKENDVGVGATKANSAIVHAGYDPAPGSLMARYNVEGNRLVAQLCARLDVLFKQTGSLVVGFHESERQAVERLYHNGIANGVPGLRMVQQPLLGQMEPGLSPEALFALYAPTAGVVNPWELALAQAEVAVQNGAEVRLNAEVTDIQKTKNGFMVRTRGGEEFFARFVVNAAGVHADKITAMLEEPAYTMHPNRGQYFLLDTSQGELVRHVVFQCPTALGKGVLVAPTVHGNLIVGPNSGPVHPDDTTTTAEGLGFVRTSALRAVPGIEFGQTIRNFAGVRAATSQPDFMVGQSAQTPGFFSIAGIKSPGLTAAPAIALHMVQMLQEAGLPLNARKLWKNTRKITRFKYLDHAQRSALIHQNPLYGSIVCRCESVTEGEIVDALHRPLPPTSLDAVKRRCTPGMGRCQGGFCGPRVQAIVARELGIPQHAVPLDRAGMDIVTGRTKEAE